tara:strand:- start:89 stop:478 length:390 start_codon:yes stop_codon:yes gene_type:complete
MTYEGDARHFVKQMDEIEADGYEVYLEKDSYTREEYKKEQWDIACLYRDYQLKLHMAVFRARNEGYEVSPKYVNCLLGRNTSSDRYDKCIICGGSIEDGIHEDAGQTKRFMDPVRWSAEWNDVIRPDSV